MLGFGPALAGHPLWHYAGACVAPLVIALVIRLSAGRTAEGRSGPGAAKRWWAAARSAPRPIQALAVGSLIVAGIHVSVCPEHFKENALYGSFFVVLATSQAGWAALVLARPRRLILRLGAAANVATIGLWLVSRTSGLPFGPEKWEVESFGRLDIAASVIEAALAAAALCLSRSAAAGDSPCPILTRIRKLLPEGTALPEQVWRQRHRWISGVLWAHIPALVIFALARGRSLLEAAVIAVVIFPFGYLSKVLAGRRRPAMVVTSTGLLTCSALLVYLSGGSIEMHFHYFVMVGLVTLYQDWWPFLIAIGYVVLQHGLAGYLDPNAVYNDPAAIRQPWTWAAIHGSFVLAMSAVGMASWRLNEALLRNVTDGQAELSQTLSLLTATLDATADGIVVVDADGRIQSWNQRFLDLWSVPVELLADGDRVPVVAHVASLVADPVMFLERAAQVGHDPEDETRDLIEFRDGRCFERFSTPQCIDGGAVGRVWSIRDVTEQRRLQEELSHQAFHDPLTGLANQALFRDRVDHALARVDRQGGRLAVLFMDLDRFKRVNDSLGHKAGDDLLVAMAERLRGVLRTADTAARLGGDEFAVLLEDVGEDEEAIATAERMAECMQRPFRPAGREVVVSASIGIAFSSPGLSGEQLLRNADLAMYSAKRRRNGGYEVYAADMHEVAIERLQLEEDLRRGLLRQELVVDYQPIVVPTTGQLVGAEALVRWAHPTRGRLLPASFVGLAEDSGLILDVGRFVLFDACRQLRQWQIDHPAAAEMGISVNVSARQLYQDDIVAEVSAALASSGLSARHLTLELTETAMMEDTPLAIERLSRLKALGVKLAIDDFGTGYSSLSYLERFPVDVLKIDRAFVMPIGTPEGETSLASAILSLARSLKLNAVAEGVETEDQVAFLSSLGCDFAQGYYYSRPVSPTAIAEMLGAPRESVAPAPGPRPERAKATSGTRRA